MPASFKNRRFVSVDPSKCTGCGICELACSQEKGEQSPLRSRIRVVRVTPVFNFALACRACEDAKCVKACPEKAISQNEDTGLLIVDKNLCEGCDWCVQACDYGAITIQSSTGLATVCDLCSGTPQCVEFCPEEALSLVESDEAASKRFNDALDELSKQFKQLADCVEKRNLQPLLADAAKRNERVSVKLEALNLKAEKALKEKEQQVPKTQKTEKEKR